MIAHEAVGGPVVAVEPVARAHPERALAILVEGQDQAVGNGVLIAGIVGVVGEGIAVVAVEPILGPNPEETLPILGQAADKAVGQALGDGVDLEARVLIALGRQRDDRR